MLLECYRRIVVPVDLTTPNRTAGKQRWLNRCEAHTLDFMDCNAASSEPQTGLGRMYMIHEAMC